jgi:calcineurin-like phosphoesterase family protein
MKIIHVSDLHFHRRDDDNKKTLALLQKVQSTAPDLDYLLVTGDVVDDGFKSQYRKVEKALEPFNGKLLLVPGNHDYGLFGNFYFPCCAEYFDNSFLAGLEPGVGFRRKHPVVRMIQKDGTKLLTVGLNSVLQTAMIFDFARGGIGESQLASLDGILSTPDFVNIPKLVYLHHRPHENDWFLAMKDAKEFMDIILKHKVSIVAFGHSGNVMIVDSASQELNVIKEKTGTTYMLDANGSVNQRKYYEIIVDKSDVRIRII